MLPGQARASRSWLPNVVVCLLAAATLSIPARVAADAPQRVSLSFVAARPVGADADPVADVLARHKVKVHLTTPTELDLSAAVSDTGSERLAAIWVDLRKSSELTIYVYDPKRERILVRVISRTAGDTAIVFETVAQVVDSAVDTLLAGGIIGVPRDQVVVLAPAPPAADVATPSPPAEAPSSVALLGLAYGLDVRTGAAFAAHGPGLGLVLLPGEGAMRFFSETHIALRIGPNPEAEFVDVSTIGGRLESLVGVARDFDGWRLAVGVGVGLQLTTISASARSRAVTASSDSTVFDPVALAAVTAWVPLSQGFELAVRCGAGLDLRPRQLVVRTSTGSTLEYDPWRVWPTLSLGVVYGL